ncbi:tetratricopeptide repeat protein [Chryseobacterium sp.]|uniref:tetratricopeptide repeat protein n=1 Tax=Chryseobacterium sp. TaxID=1871047 RepID=UPI001B2A341A|nr:tetratricopeptide repeat protein [Chryseobacterium sp.]MBO9690631.1 tetratricopeptide repeat protein [Chryseobacterium sp.]
MRKYLFSLLFGTLFSIPVLACLNGEQMVLANHQLLYSDYESDVPSGHDFGSKKRLEAFVAALEKGYQKTKEIEYLSDKGFVLIILKRYQEAIDLYKEVESIEPGRYSTASNMGTAYELIGNNREAFKWIEMAVKIKPNSHLKSEWIHINILKAKMKGGSSVSSVDLIGKDFGNRQAPQSTLSKDDLQMLKMQIYYQLNERMSFVKPKDKIVARLLFDLGNIEFLMNQKDDAMEDYQLAVDYGFDNPIIKKRLKLYTPVLSKPIEKLEETIHYHMREPQRFELMEMMIAVSAFLGVGCLAFTFRRKIFLLLK